MDIYLLNFKHKLTLQTIKTSHNIMVGSALSSTYFFFLGDMIYWSILLTFPSSRVSFVTNIHPLSNFCSFNISSSYKSLILCVTFYEDYYFPSILE